MDSVLIKKVKMILYDLSFSAELAQYLLEQDPKDVLHPLIELLICKDRVVVPILANLSQHQDISRTLTNELGVYQQRMKISSFQILQQEVERIQVDISGRLTSMQYAFPRKVQFGWFWVAGTSAQITAPRATARTHRPAPRHSGGSWTRRQLLTAAAAPDRGFVLTFLFQN